MTDHDFNTFWEAPDWRPKEYPGDEVEYAECRRCGLRFQSSIVDDTASYDYDDLDANSVVLRKALSPEWLAGRGYPASCEEHVVRAVHNR